MKQLPRLLSDSEIVESFFLSIVTTEFLLGKNLVGMILVSFAT